MLVRTKMPKIREVENLVLPRPELYHLPNGIPVYDTNLGTQDIVKLDIVFFAGRPFERKKLASRATASLLREGTPGYTSSGIAEIFDYYGASLSTPVGLDTVSVLLYSLKRNFGKLLPVVAEILSQPLFPQKELDAFSERNKQRLQVDLAKNDVLAYRKFTELLYGEDHPYGYNSFAETYDALTRDDLVTHFQENFTTGNCMMFVSGSTGNEIRLLLEQHFGKIIRQGERRQVTVPPAKTTPQHMVIEHPDAVQSAIRIGCPLFNRLHPDYNGMYVLNTILGGYFGSRLMTNIREEKGYTYNIYSSHEAMLYGGYFYVSTEVGNEFRDLTLREIYAEMKRLQTRPVGREEMKMVRNYLLGSLLTHLDGAFNIAEVVKTFVTEGVPLSHFEALVETVKTVSPKHLQELAQKYFRKENMWEVVV